MIHETRSSIRSLQTTLKRDIIQESTYYILGFVPADVVRLRKVAWFSKLSDEQITSVEKFLESKKRVWDYVSLVNLSYKKVFINIKCRMR